MGRWAGAACLFAALAACDEPPTPGSSPPEPPEEAPEPPPAPPAPRLPPPAPSEGAPAGWPEGFPFLPGGTLQPAPPGPAGLVTHTVVYPAHAPPALADRLALELEGAGWTVSRAPPSPRGTQRMTATRAGRSVQASVLNGPGGAGSALLLMQL